MILSKRQQIAMLLGLKKSEDGREVVALSNRQRIADGIKAMAQLAANSTNVSFATTPQFEESLPVDASANAGGGIIYAGAFLGFNAATGYVRQYVAGDTYAGVAKRAADNSGTGNPLGNTTNIGSGAAGGTVVPTQTKGHFYWGGPITGAAATVADVGTVVYASDSGTLTTFNPGSGKVGVITAFGLTNAGNNQWEITQQSAAERLA